MELPFVETAVGAEEQKLGAPRSLRNSGAQDVVPELRRIGDDADFASLDRDRIAERIARSARDPNAAKRSVADLRKEGLVGGFLERQS